MVAGRQLLSVAGVGACAAALALARSALLVVAVDGISMMPTYAHGDRVLVLRRRWCRAPRRGDVVVLRRPPRPHGQPRAISEEEQTALAGAFPGVAELDRSIVEVKEWAPGRTARPDLLVKRVAAIAGDPYPKRTGTVPVGQVYVLGDAPESYDSKDFGPIPEDRVIGMVIRDLRSGPRSPSPEG